MSEEEYAEQNRFNYSKYDLQDELIKQSFGLTNEDLERMAVDPDNAHVPQAMRWVEAHASLLNDLLISMPEAERNALFDKFKQDKSATTKMFLAQHPELRDQEPTVH
jgi:hypothetical protein